MAPKTTFIVNPQAANGATGRAWPRIHEKAKDRLSPFDVSITTGPGHATELARTAVDQGSEVIVCVGGDGTLNEVVNGLMGINGEANLQAMLGFIPSGTGGDLAKSLAIPRDLDKALTTLQACQHRAVDLGRMTYSDSHGNPGVRYFHNVLSFGLGGEVDERVNRTSKALGGFLSFIWATLISIVLYSKKSIDLEVDDSFQGRVEGWNVAVANGQYHGGGMWVAPGALMDDGLFQITVIGDLNLPQVFWNLPRLYNGKIYDHPKIKRLTGRRIRASSDQQVLIDMDGEQPGQLPVVIEMIPSALRIICPT